MCSMQPCTDTAEPAAPLQHYVFVSSISCPSTQARRTWMQSRWNTWPQQPQAMDRPGWSGSPVGFAWYSMLGSYRLLRQMAHVSVQIWSQR
jgi:hypothetical protein